MHIDFKPQIEKISLPFTTIPAFSTDPRSLLPIPVHITTKKVTAVREESPQSDEVTVIESDEEKDSEDSVSEEDDRGLGVKRRGLSCCSQESLGARRVWQWFGRRQTTGGPGFGVGKEVKDGEHKPEMLGIREMIEKKLLKSDTDDRKDPKSKQSTEKRIAIGIGLGKRTERIFTWDDLEKPSSGKHRAR